MPIERVSIIVVDHSDPRYLTPCLESIRRASSVPVQTVRVPESTLGDNASPANRATAINAGLRQVTGQVVGWITADDIYQPQALDHVAKYFSDHPEVDVVYGKSQHIDGEANAVCPLNVPDWKVGRLQRRCFLQFPAVFYRRRLFDGDQNLDTRLEYWEDYQWCLTLEERGAKFAKLEETLAAKRIHMNNRIIGTRVPHHLQRSAEEVVSLFTRQDPQLPVPARWALHSGHVAAETKDLSAEKSMDYDRLVLRTAIRAATPVGGRPRRTDRWWATARVLIQHVAHESKAISRRPRLATRFLPPFPQHLHRQFWDRKLFRLHNYEPRSTWHIPVATPSAPTANRGLALPTISIVTPNLNQGQFIGRTIRSVTDQAYAHLEYVVEDGASTDNSVQVIQEHAAVITKWQSAPDSGQADAINRGMRKTTGQIMAYLNSDDLLLPGSLDYVAQFFANNPSVDVVYGHRLLVDERDREIGRWILPPHDDKLIAWADYIPQETLFWRRRAWEAIGGQIDDSFQFALDWDMILRFRSEGMTFRRLPRVLGAFRVTEQQKTRQLIGTVGRTEMNRLRIRELGRIPSDREIRQRIKPYLRRHWVADKMYALSLLYIRS